jgi:predicted nucleotidyltransferase
MDMTTRWTLESLRQRRQEIERIAEKWGARHIRVFGSVATGVNGPASDVDLIVTFDEERNLLDHGGLLMDLQEALDCRVDVVDEDAMRSRFRARVEKEAVTL